MKRAILIPALVLATSAIAFAGLARADEASRIAVSVKGQASAIADTVEVELTVSARADESTDAERKYRSKLASLLAALKEGKTAAKPVKKEKAPDKAEKADKKKASDDDDDDAPKKAPAKKDDDSHAADDAAAAAIPVEVSERGLAFGVKASKDDANPFKALAKMGGGPAQNPDPPMTFSSKVVATIKGVKKLDPKLIARRVAQLIDLGIDSGADGTDSASAPSIRFNLDDLEGLRAKAYEDAMTRAKARAEKLATLGGRKLGAVWSVRDGTSGAASLDAQAAQMKVVQNMFGSSSSGDAPTTGFEVSVEVELAVEFEIAK